MDSPLPATAPARPVELWLLRPGTASELATSALRATTADLVLSAPGREPGGEPGGDEAHWAAALAGEARHERSADLGPRRAHEDERALAARVFAPVHAAVCAARAGVTARVIVVVELGVLRAIVAAALGIPPGRHAALEVEAGRAVMLRDDPLGYVLRRANVCAPEREDESGDAMPTWKGAGQSNA